MNIFITGGGGFVGTYLSTYFLEKGHSVVSVGLSPPPSGTIAGDFTFIKADTTQTGDWQQHVKNADAVINLAGKTIFKRWTDKYKKAIYASRIQTTRNLVAALPDNTAIPFLSTSAVGFYGNRGDDILTEDTAGGDDFLAVVSRDWEAEAMKSAEKGARPVLMRFGVVLGKNGGAMAKMIPAFRMFVGGPIGSGKQWFPWIHIQDLAEAVSFIMDNTDISGPVNFCGQHPARNRDLAQALGQALGRPSIMPAPAFMVRLAMGEMGNAVLFSQRPVPKKLIETGFQFTYPDIRSAVAAVVE